MASLSMHPCFIVLPMVALSLIGAAICWPIPDESTEGSASGESMENFISENLAILGETVFGNPNNDTGVKVSNWKTDHPDNPEELGEYLEGDILFPLAQARNGLRAESSRWPKGRVPYQLSPYYNSADREMIMSAIDQYHKHTCIQFVPRSGTDRDYLAINPSNTGCWSSVGRVGGMQELNLQAPGCLTKIGTPIHEMMHALGFYHEHTRWERDRHVTILWDNVQKDRSNNFQKASKKTTDALGVEYDYRSVMHYSAFAFSTNGKETIKAKISGTNLGQRDGFSRGDIKKINRMYKCKNKKKKN